jgi:hypothetical protein
MLINLSNHPQNKWDIRQIEQATKLYGSIRDIAFPAIDPLDKLDVIKKMALNYASTCIDLLKKSRDAENAIHVMGELTFCYQFVKIMQQQNIQCIASTSERTVAYTQDGKVSLFIFQQFRNYY